MEALIASQARTVRRRAARRRDAAGVAVLDLLKGALFSTAAAYVALSILMPFAADLPPTPPNLCREALSFFALSALAVLVFPRVKLWAIAVCLAGYALGLEAARMIPVLHHSADLLIAAARLAGVAAAIAPAGIGRMFLSQPRGASPTSLAYLP